MCKFVQSDESLQQQKDNPEWPDLLRLDLFPKGISSPILEKEIHLCFFQVVGILHAFLVSSR